ncbi:MAG: DUF86 domain-containing protein [bacterium]|nr:DUF86 domain-containing protein [bacterium]
MSAKRDVKLFVQDVLNSIEQINSYVSVIADENTLKKNKQVYDAVMMNFIIIGEAIKNIYIDVRENHPEVEWRQIMAMRNIMVHEYWGINEGVVWDSIKNNLPQLKEIIIKIKDSLK